MLKIEYKGELKKRFWSKRAITLKIIDIFYGSMTGFVEDIDLKITNTKGKQ